MAEEGYYILDTHNLRNRSLAAWQRPDGFFCTTDIDEAGVYGKAEADAICAACPDHVAIPVSEARALAVLVVEVSQALVLKTMFAKKEGSNV
jgi:hypothetical protein